MISTVKTRQASVPVFGAEHHRMTKELQPGDRFLIRLSENPGAGYGWNANKTHGLQIIDHWYAPTEPVTEFSGGFHYWSIRATVPGKQIFRAVHWRKDGTGNFPPIIFQLLVNVPDMQVPQRPVLLFHIAESSNG